MGRRIVLAAVSVGACLTALATASAARHAALSACTQDTSPLATTFAHRVRGDVVGLTALGTWGTASCLLHEHLRFAVTTYAGRKTGRTLSAVAGNPGAKTLNTVLRPGDVLVYSWRWHNWCGAQDPFVVQSTWSGAVDSGGPSEKLKAPACVDRKTRSSLSAVPVSIGSCAPSDFQPATGLGQPMETRLIEFVQFNLRAGHGPCLLSKVRVQFTVQGRADGKWASLSGVAGNPATRIVGAMLTPNYKASFVFWAWSNWCGGGDHFRALARVSPGFVTGPSQSQGATCVDSGAGSTLAPSYGHAP